MRTLEKQFKMYYNAGQAILEKYNPCEISKNENGDVTCIASRMKLVRHNTLCCEGCDYHSVKTGCKVKSIGCKLGMCYIGVVHDLLFPKEWNDASEKLYELRVKAKQILRFYYRETKKEVLLRSQPLEEKNNV